MSTAEYLSGTVNEQPYVKGKSGPLRKEPVWEMRYRIPGKQSAMILGKVWHKQSRPPKGYLTRGQAEAIKEQFLADNAEAGSEASAGKTFKRAVADYFRDCERERNLRKSTLYDYRALATRLGKRRWKDGLTWDDRPLASFTERDILAVREELLDLGRAWNTINHYHTVLQGIFGSPSVADAWKFKTPKPDNGGKLKFYTMEEVEKLLEHAADDRDRAIYTLATESGARRSEIVGLKVIDVDFAAGVLRIQGGITIQGGAAGTKSRKVRSVELSPNVADALRPFCEGRPHYYEDGEETLVFEHELKGPGVPIDAEPLYKRFKKACREAGLPPRTFHELRHTYGTQMIATGCTMERLKEFMGHADIQTTQIYTHHQANPAADSELVRKAFGHRRSAGDNVVSIRANAPSKEANHG